MSDAPLVTGTDFVMLPVTDFEAAKEFYVGVLGLEAGPRYGDSGFGGEFETGNLTIAAIDVARLGREFEPTRGAIALRVDDVAAARAQLEAQGVEFKGDIVDSGVCHQAYFADPDGNQLILHHRYAPRAPG
jgi:catechol 2,3-dioxygenase-like lactoylglutathione lyase family enzyme